MAAQSQDDVRALADIGLRPDAFHEPLPDLSPDAEQAARCWHFCGGWNPERLPLFGAFEHVTDWAGLVDLMQAIHAAQHEAEKEARGHG